MRICIIALLIITLGTACSTVQNKEQQSLSYTLSLIKRLNTNYPDTVRANVTVISKMARMQSITANGIAYMQNKPAKVRVSLQEPIFKSPVIELYADNQSVRIFYPINKIAQVIRGDFSNPSFNSNDFSDSRLMIANTFTGKIPLITGYKVVEHSVTSTNRVLKLRNDFVAEDITFDASEHLKKIIITNLETQVVFTIEYSGMYLRDGYTFFKSIKASSSLANERITIYFRKIFINPSISTRIFRLKIPQSTKYIR